MAFLEIYLCKLLYIGKLTRQLVVFDHKTSVINVVVRMRKVIIKGLILSL